MRNDIPLSNGQAKALVLIIAVIASAIAAPMLMLPDSGQPTGENGEVATATPTPAKGTVQEFTGSDMASVPESHQSIPSNTTDPDVRVSDGSQTMQIEAEKGESLKMVLSDEQTHEGRWVSVSAVWLEESLGEVPAMVTIRHDSGDVYHEPVHVDEEDGRASFWVEEFSTNTVTFTGEISISDRPAQDGTKHVYDVSSLDSASNPNVTFTGSMATEWDNESRQHLEPGEAMSISPAGNRQPVGEDGGDPSITVTGDRDTDSLSLENCHNCWVGDSQLWIGVNDNDPVKSEWELNDPPARLKEIQIDENGWSDSGGDGMEGTFDVYVAEEEADGTYEEGTKIAGGVSYDQGDDQTIDVDYDVGENANDLTIAFVPDSLSDDDREGPKVDDDGDHRIEGDKVTDLTVSSDSDSKTIGDLADGESETVTLDIDTSDTEIETSHETGLVDMEVDMKERTETVDPKVEVNDGNWMNHSGTLGDGETATVTGDSAWLQSGENHVNVSVGDGSLSSDAPTPQVEVVYSHDATDDKSVDYSAEAFSERYNISKTYASDRSNATLTIPFDSSRVVAMRAVEYRVNESGSWSSVDSADYRFDGTTLTANISDIYGGEVPAGATIEVRANATKVKPINGSISVTDPTPVGEQLNSEIQVEEAGENFRIETDEEEVHYAHNASYDSESYWVVDDQGTGQRLHLPNAESGDTTRISTVPVEADPDGGDAHIEVSETSREEPAISVEPGTSDDDEVAYTFTNAEGGVDYNLYSNTHDIVRDSGTAESPLTLNDDDSEEILVFMRADSADSDGGDGGDGGGGGAGIVAAPSSDGFTDNLVPLSFVALAAAALIVVSRNDDEVAQAGDRTADGIEGALSGIPIVGPALGQATAGLVRSGAQLGRALLNNQTVTMSLLGAIGLAAIQSGVIQVPDSTMPLLVLVAVAAGSWISLRDTGNWDIRLWIGLVGASTIVTVVAISDADPVTAVTQSRVFPILALGGLYLGYKLIQDIGDALGDDGGDGGSGGVTVQADTVVRRDGGDD